MTFDLLLSRTTVVDGTGRPRFAADLGVRSDRIAAVGDLGRAEAKRRIDAAGLVAAPGFVDLHSHHDLVLALPPSLQARYLEGRIRQGITTEVVGNCGYGAFPVSEASLPAVRAMHRFFAPPEAEWSWKSASEWFDRLERQGVLANVAALVPHGPLRTAALGMERRAARPDEVESMRRALRESLDAGAVGLSFGLIYPPGQFAPTEEIARLCEALPRGAFAAFHQRSGSAELLERSIEEIVEVGRTTGAAVHLSHEHAQGERAWPLVEALLGAAERARSEGVDYTQDVIPYTGVNTTMLALYPGWALEGGVGGFLERARDPVARARMREEMATTVPAWPPWIEGNWCTNLVRDSGWRSVHLAHSPRAEHGRFEGSSAAAIAEALGKTPFDAITDLLVEADGDLTMLLFGISGDRREDGPLRALLAAPGRAIVSDAWECGQGKPHPGAYGAFPHAIARFVRGTKTLSLEDAIRRMTSLPADRLGLRDRGRIEKGAFADLVVFDPEAIAATSTYEEPRRNVAGVRHVILNGKFALDDGRFTGEPVGRVLRKD